MCVVLYVIYIYMCVFFCILKVLPKTETETQFQWWSQTQPVLHPGYTKYNAASPILRSPLFTTQNLSLVGAEGNHMRHQTTITGKSSFIHMHSVYSEYILYLYILNNNSKTMKSRRLQKQMGLEASSSHKAYWSGLECLGGRFYLTWLISPL